MHQSYQELERRKKNITSIEPLISAMRTISLSQWRMALNRQKGLAAFLDELNKVNMVLHGNLHRNAAKDKQNNTILIILGSNRGLCGNFNKRLRQLVKKEHLAATNFSRIFLVGKQLPPLFKQIATWESIDVSFPDLHDIKDVSTLLSMETPRLINGVDITVLYNKYQGAGRYKTVFEQIYPILQENAAERQEIHETVILDTDPGSMQIMLEHLTFNTHLQSCFYSSMASEHSSRFAMMENAEGNVEDLINELDVLLQDFRKGKITIETQELAVASGLLST